MGIFVARGELDTLVRDAGLFAHGCRPWNIPRKFTEPVALLSTRPSDRSLPRRALRQSFDLLALRARCRGGNYGAALTTSNTSPELLLSQFAGSSSGVPTRAAHLGKPFPFLSDASHHRDAVLGRPALLGHGQRRSNENKHPRRVPSSGVPGLIRLGLGDSAKLRQERVAPWFEEATGAKLHFRGTLRNSAR